MNCVDIALRYRAAGLCPLPVKLDTKRPALHTWKPFQQCLPHEQQIRTWFADCDGVCLVLGAVSGNALGLDFDQGGELYEPWKQAVVAQAPLLFPRLVVESSRSGGRHVYWRIANESLKSQKLAERAFATPGPEDVVVKGKTYKPAKAGDHYEVMLTLIETRGEKGIMVCAPTPGYVLEHGALENLPTLTQAESDLLLEAACALNEHIPKPKPIPKHECRPDAAKEPRHEACAAAGARPGDEFNTRGDIRPILLKHGWTLVKPGENEYWRRPGKDIGTSATLKNGVFYCFTTSATPFEGNTPYSPFHVYTLLEHSGDFSKAAAALGAQGYGSTTANTDVNIDGITSKFRASDEDKSPPGPPDPGPLPEELLRIPGFISELMDYCLTTAPYPNVVMAFAGALALQAFLAGRKVCDPGDNRTNLYLLGLAHSASGKDWPRKINTRVLHKIGLASALGERFASGEGIQDALFVEPTMLFQTDEIDGILQALNKAQDARHENIMGTLLTMYSSANSVFPMRRKAGVTAAGVIDQPCLVIFGTAIPNHYYEALSERMLTNGFFARMLILEGGPRPKGQEPSICDVPPRILAISKWWSDFTPGNGNLKDWHPIPLVVPHAENAKRVLIETRELAETEYAQAEERNDAVGTTVWGRVNEQVRKLSLIYAISADHEEPQIELSAAQWATRLVLHQTRRMLFMAQDHVAENPFQAECLKLIRKLREAPGQRMAHSLLLKRMKLDTKTFQTLISTLEQRGDIEAQTIASDGRPGRFYRLGESSQ